MFAIDHSATALLIKRRFPSVSMTPLLISVQAMELMWVALNYLGVEQTTTSVRVRTVADIQLAYIPYSHSVATVTGAALVAWWALERCLGRRALGRAVAIGIVSHLVLDIATHARDIVLWPGSPFVLGLGLYSGAPAAAFVLELTYGVLCWWIYGGTRALLWVIVAGNLADLSFFFAGIPGPKQFLAGHPMLIVTLIFGQIVAMLVLVSLFSSKPSLPLNEPVPRGLQQSMLRERRHPVTHQERATLTRREQLVYRTATGLVLGVMVFSIINFVFNDHFPFPNGPEGAFAHLGFPEYFKVELTVAKILGVLALLIPAVPFKLKEFAYFGFAITLVSASIAHFSRGDGDLSVLFVVDPLVFCGLLAISYLYFVKSRSLRHTMV